MSYQRVIPRDLFNEAKLLKCIGKLAVLIHNNQIPGLRFEHDGEPFEIVQGIGGDLMVNNIRFYAEDGEEVFCSISYNSKENWPLEIEYKNQFRYPINEAGEYQLSDLLFKKKGR